jgi:hypothetical protein
MQSTLIEIVNKADIPKALVEDVLETNSSANLNQFLDCLSINQNSNLFEYKVLQQEMIEYIPSQPDTICHDLISFEDTVDQVMYRVSKRNQIYDNKKKCKTI